MATAPRALAVYRSLLRTLQQWPSVRRDKVAHEIRDEFRRNAHEPSSERAEKMLQEAEAGLRSLRAQCGLSEGTDVSYTCDTELRRGR